jgi:hypothetical protein
VFANNKSTFIFIATALNARFSVQFPQPSFSRDIELHHPDICSLDVATKVVSPLPGPTGKQKQARYIRKKILEDRNRRKIGKKKKVSIKNLAITVILTVTKN